MAKMTKKKFQEYKEINENGFTINLYKLMNQFAYGDEYPQMNCVLSNTEKIQLVVTVSYFKFYNGKGEYRIEAKQYKKSTDSTYIITDSTSCFNKVYYIEKTDNKTRFNFKRIKELCNKFNKEELKIMVLNDYTKHLNIKESIAI